MVHIPKRFMSPFHTLLTAIILLVIIFNVSLYRHNKNQIPSYVKNYLNSGRETYMINSQHHLQSAVDKVDSQDFLAVLMKELKQAKSADLIDELKKDLKEENEKQLKEDLRKMISQQYMEQFKEELKIRVQSDFSHQIYNQLHKSYKIMSDLSQDFLLRNKEKVTESAALTTLQEVIDKDPQLSKEFKLSEKLNEQIDKIIDKKAYFKFLFDDLLLMHKTQARAITDKEKSLPLTGQYYNSVYREMYTKEFLLEQMTLPAVKVMQIQDAHNNLLRDLRVIDDPPFNVAHGDGIVINAGGEFLGGALVVVGQLREMGSELPIELILNVEDDYDKFICDDLLPNKFNARCVVIEREIGAEMYKKLNLSKFQLKALGFLVSSFDNTIALDSDNLPIKNVDYLLDNDPFLSTKFVMWPDIWLKSTSPYFYECVNIRLGQPIRRQGIANNADYIEYLKKDRFLDVELHDLEGTFPGQSVESGQMVFSKKKHFKSILLALYYNIQGPDYYYPLLYQGAPGSGDRETFVAALNVLKEPYHLVNYNVWLAGHTKDINGGEVFEDTTIVQYDPVQVLAFQEDWGDFLQKNKLDGRLWPFQDNEYTKSILEEFKKSLRSLERLDDTEDGKPAYITHEYQMPEVLFLHSRRPKINFLKNGAPKDPIDTYSRRNLGKPGAYEKEFGPTDWELKFHTISKWFACVGIQSDEFWTKANLDKNDVCSKVTKYVEFLQSNTKDLSAGDLVNLQF